jgi:hypothetical protein
MEKEASLGSGLLKYRIKCAIKSEGSGKEKGNVKAIIQEIWAYNEKGAV